MSIEKPDFPINIENSPIEFALMGPLGRHRGVLVKSKNASLDLIGYDNPHVDLFLGRNPYGSVSRGSILYLWRTALQRPTVYVARSHGATLNNANTRKTYYNFAWRGMCDERDFQKFQSAFEESVPDLNEALEGNDLSQVEWTISGLVTACSMMQKRAESKTKNFRIATNAYISIVILIFMIFILGQYLRQ